MTAFRHSLLVLLIWFLGSLAAVAQDAKPLRGVALIIGQANYAHVAELPNAGADARAIGKLMTDLGFETRLAPDRNAKALKREINRFIEDAEGADVAFVYYAGHGVEAAGENWLVPVDADLSSLTDARQNLVAASDLLERLKQAVPVVIVLLDACRNSPFPADALLKPDAQSASVPVVATGLTPSRGVAVVEEQKAAIENVGLVMGYAAEPGHAALDGPQGGNSPYAEALLRHLGAIGGNEFGDVMTMVTEEVYLATGTRQRPWVNASMRRLLYFGMTPEEGDKDEALITGERRKLLLTIAALPASGRQQVEGIAKSDQVPLDSLYGMLKSLGVETPKDPAELDRLLRAQAEKLKTVLAEAAALKSTDPEIVRLSGLADRALTQGALQTAIAFREQAKTRATSQSAALDQTEAALAARRLELAEVFSRSGETYSLAFNYKAAAADFQKAFTEVERWNDDLAWKYKQREGEAWRAHGVRQGDKAAFALALSAYETAARLVTPESKPQEWVNTQLGLGGALRFLGERDPNAETLRKSVALLQSVMSKRTDLKPGVDWSGIENELAMSLWRLGEREPGTLTLEQAAAAFETALADIPKDSSPLYRAAIETNLGVVLSAAGQRDSTSAAFDRAISVFERALARFPKSDAPMIWAVMQNNLASTLSYKGRSEGGTATLEKSVTAFRAVLSEFKRETVPHPWAMATNNLGMTLLYLGERQPSNDNLLAAERQFSAALTELTRDRTPMDWAAVMSNRGLALLRLGERAPETAKLNEAIAAFNDALTVRTRQTDPLNWADIQRNLGFALVALGHRQGDTRSYHQAIAAFEAAAGEMTKERAPFDWASVTLNLGVSLTYLGMREPDTASFDRAIQVFRAALTPDVKASMPANWGSLNYYLGNAILEKAKRETGTVSLLEARAAYEDAQQEMTREKSPAFWAEIENNIAATHFFMGQRSDSKAEFELARSATLAAWEVFKSAGDKSRDAAFEGRLAEIDAELADLE